MTIPASLLNLVLSCLAALQAPEAQQKTLDAIRAQLDIISPR